MRNLHRVSVVFSVVSGILISGCETQKSIVGVGPVELTATQSVRFEDWKSGARGDPLYFFLRTDGTAYAVHCTGVTASLCREAYPEDWHKTCETSRPGVSCQQYGAFGQVVWQFNTASEKDIAITPEAQRLNNALGDAVITGKLENVQTLLSEGADPNAMTAFTHYRWNRGREWRTSVLVAAIVHHQPKIVTALLKRKVSFDRYHNAFAICPAVNSGQALLVLDLIKAGINVNPAFKCIRKLSPLESAKRRQNDGIIKALVDAGAT